MLKKQKTEQAVKWNKGLPLLGVRIDFSILIWSINLNQISENWKKKIDFLRADLIDYRKID